MAGVCRQLRTITMLDGCRRAAEPETLLNRWNYTCGISRALCLPSYCLLRLSVPRFDIDGQDVICC